MHSALKVTLGASLLILGLATLSAVASAQDVGKTETAQGQAQQEVQVQSGTVLYVSGNDLVVKTQEGQIKHFHVPDSARANVDGKELSVHDLKPGMTLQRTITTTTTPETVTTIRTIKGKVTHVQAPNYVILQLPDGTNKQYKIPEGQKFNIDGQEVDAFHLKKGMKVSATVVKEVPATVVEQQAQVTGKMPPPPTPPPATGVLLIEAVPSAPEAVTAAAPEQQVTSARAALPETASPLPLVGGLGLLFAATGMVMPRARRH